MIRFPLVRGEQYYRRGRDLCYLHVLVLSLSGTWSSWVIYNHSCTILVIKNQASHVLATQHGQGWRTTSGDTFITASLEVAGDGLG